MSDSNGTVHVTFKRRKNRDGLTESIIYEWLKGPDGLELTQSESNWPFSFARLIATIDTAEGLPFDVSRVKQDKIEAISAYNAWLDMDELVTSRLEDERAKYAKTIDPALAPEPPDKGKKKSGGAGE